MKDLKEKTLRGGVARLCAQAVNFVFRLGSLMVLARLLSPKDFGLVGMVTAFTGILGLFRDFGLSSAAIQRETVTEEQLSTLFWINIIVGLGLGAVAAALAPAVAAFYHEPRLIAVTIVLALGFVFNAAGVQHSALLQREMRFTSLAVINTLGLVFSSVVAFVGAKAGYGYWALVAMTVLSPLVITIGCWLTADWIPGMPHRNVGIRSMIRFGGTLTLNGVVAYIAFNFEKILLGRFWGVDAIGIYGRAYQLSNIPADNLNAAAGEVAFSALSRTQGDPRRFRSYFLKGYSLIVSLTIPITIACALFADDLIRVVLGPQWKAAAPIFRILAPTILVLALINPLGWLLYSLGLVGRSLKIALVFAPLIIAGYFIGLPYGPQGVAFAYSTVMVLWVIPHIAWCTRGTVVSLRDIFLAVRGPLMSSIVAAVLAIVVRFLCGGLSSHLLRLVLESAVLFAAYFGIVFFVVGQRSLYIDILRAFKPVVSADDGRLVSA